MHVKNKILFDKLKYSKSVILQENGPNLVAGVQWKKQHEVGLIIRPLIMGVCRSDIKEIKKLRDGVSQFGHEFVGYVELKWGNVDFNIGDIVCMDPNVILNRSSGFSELIPVDGLPDEINKAFYKVPKKGNLYKLLFAEPLSCALHCVRRILSCLNKSNYNECQVGVIGAGIAGTLIALAAKKLGANISIVNRNNDRLDFLLEKELFSISELVELKSFCDFKNRYDIVILATSFITSDLVSVMFPIVKNNGIVVFYGGTSSGDRIEFCQLNIDELRRNEENVEIEWNNKLIKMLGCYGTDDESFQMAIDCLSRNDACFPLERLIVEEISLQKLPIVLQKMASERYLGKVIIK